MENNKIKIVILAAGKGTRMKSDLPKALAPLHGKPMINHILQSIEGINDSKPIIIIGYQGDLVKNTLGDSYEYAIQTEQLGTANAISAVRDLCGDAEDIVVLSSDQPLIKRETILECIARHKAVQAKITLTTTEVPDFEEWRKYFLTHGRILRQEGKIIGIKEYNDATEEEKNIKEVNTGCCYVFNSAWLWANIGSIRNDNSKNEYYLTDLISLAALQNAKIEAMKIDPIESLGANSKEELAVLENLGV
ncbi:MAG: NTP transferase domain-containing protein [Candidatus Paceibacterota bacterium]